MYEEESESTKIMRELLLIRRELSMDRLSFQHWSQLENKEKFLIALLIKNLHDEYFDKFQ